MGLYEDLKKLESRVDDLVKKHEELSEKVSESEVKIKDVQNRTSPKQTQVIDGITHPTPNTKLEFLHRIKTANYCLVVRGNIYIQDLTPDIIDVRSDSVSEAFTIIVTE